MFKTSNGWIKHYKEKGALWQHDGNRKRPHALLTSGMHSDGYFNSEIISADQVSLHEAASDLLELFGRQDGNILKVQGVIGPQKGGAKLAEAISSQITSQTRDECFWVSPVKNTKGDVKSMVFSPREASFITGEHVLLCDDAISTGGSIELTETAVENAEGFILPFVLALLNRSGLTEINDKIIVSLIDLHMQMWAPEKCPFCKQGSKALRPEEHWDRLNKKY